jgi:hypothetical protein
MNTLYIGNCLNVLRDNIPDEKFGVPLNKGGYLNENML